MTYKVSSGTLSLYSLTIAANHLPGMTEHYSRVRRNTELPTRVDIACNISRSPSERRSTHINQSIKSPARIALTDCRNFISFVNVYFSTFAVTNYRQTYRYSRS